MDGDFASDLKGSGGGSVCMGHGLVFLEPIGGRKGRRRMIAFVAPRLVYKPRGPGRRLRPKAIYAPRPLNQGVKNG
jgi:hypothetical protein